MEKFEQNLISTVAKEMGGGEFMHCANIYQTIDAFKKRNEYLEAKYNYLKLILFIIALVFIQSLCWFSYHQDIALKSDPKSYTLDLQWDGLIPSSLILLFISLYAVANHIISGNINILRNVLIIGFISWWIAGIRRE